MKELTKKILEAGLVDKTVVQLLERWHLLSPEEAAIATKPVVVVEALEKFVENLEELLDKEPSDATTIKPLRETRLEIVVSKPPIDLFFFRRSAAPEHRHVRFSAVEDEMGRLIINPDVDTRVGDFLMDDKTGKVLYTVLGIEDLYMGNELVAKQITVNPR